MTKPKQQQQPDQIQYLPHTQLEIHPRNMRRLYPDAQVRQMSDSIRSRGVILPLIAVPIKLPSCSLVDESTSHPTHYIIAGNLRLQALRLLGPDAPPAPVIVRDRTLTDQLLDMAAENSIRFQPDIISEARHYHYLLQQPGMTQTQLAHETGVSYPTITKRLKWLDLEPEIQDLAAAGDLPKLAATDLLRLPAGDIRIRTATRAATGNFSLKTLTRICTRIITQLESQPDLESSDSITALQRRKPQNSRSLPVPSMPREGLSKGPLPAGTIRESARRACSICPNTNTLGVPEPAWTILSHGAQQVCEDCNLNTIRSICNDCPLTMALRHVYRQVVRDLGQEVPHERF